MNAQAWAILLAAGRGKRLKRSPADPDKQFIQHRGLPLFWHAARTLAAVPGVDGLLLVFPPDELDYASALTASLRRQSPLGLPCLIAAGGEERQDSVWNALQALPPECAQVLVHDAARPFVGAALVLAVLEALRAGHAGVVPGLEPRDTLKRVNPEGLVLHTLQRGELRCAQTPQGFDRRLLEKACRAGREQGLRVTDDAALLEAAGIPVLVIPGEAGNDKITLPADLKLLTYDAGASGRDLLPCSGFGYDVHRYGGRRPLKLGGVPIPSGGLRVEAHSDGDVLLHALMDALLGCAAAGDIGLLFPDTDGRYDNMNSAILLSEVLELTRGLGLRLTHVDLTVVAQAPKIQPFRGEIIKNVAHLLHLDEGWINLKATTEEGLGFTGAGQGLKALALVSALKPCPSARIDHEQ